MTAKTVSDPGPSGFIRACLAFPARRPACAAALLCGLVVAAYAPVFHNGFIWDDDSSLTQNHFIQASDGLGRFWFTTQTPDYWPVTASTFWLEWRLWGAQAIGYHATNLVLHVLAALLLWAILRRLRVPGAYFAALLFAVHPVNVESVAWIAQRKNLLGMLFFLASILCFLKTGLAAPAGQDGRAGRGRWYGLSVAAFLLAMLSKGSVAPLPLVLLGLIWWHRRPRARDLAQLAPFFLIALVLAGVDAWFQTHGTGEVIRQAGGIERLLGAAAVVWFYLAKALLPIRLLFVYPAWRIQAGDPLWWLPLLGALGLTGALWAARRPARPALFAWLYFCAMLGPVLGFSDVYFMRFSLVADHYQYLAIIGIIALAAAGWGRWAGLAGARAHPAAAVAAAAALVGLLAGLSWRQSRSYRDSETLFRATLAGNPAAWLADTNLGAILVNTGRPREAAGYLVEALRLHPDLPQAELDLGTALRALGRKDEAMSHYAAGLRLSPASPGAHYDVGVGLADARRLPEAVAQFAQALQLRRDYPEAENALGNALRQLGRVPEALPHLRRAIELRPDFPEAENNLGIALAQSGDLPEAIAHLERAAQLGPGYLEAENNLGIALAQAGRMTEAIVHFERMVQLRPANAQFRFNLANALAQAGRLPEAAAQYAEALRLNPAFTPAREMLDRISAAGALPSSGP
jgi:tetratricopeptide (TPR) repeat protein